MHLKKVDAANIEFIRKLVLKFTHLHHLHTMVQFRVILEQNYLHLVFELRLFEIDPSPSCILSSFVHIKVNPRYTFLLCGNHLLLKFY